MIKTDPKRRRKRANFQPEQPMRYRRNQGDDHRLGGLADALPGLSPEAKILARNRLVVISTHLQFSRKFENKRATRPDANFTLRVIARMALELLAVIEGLSEEAVAKISERFDPSCLSYYEPGAAAIEAVAIILDELAMASYDANHARAKRSDPLVERCAEIERLEVVADFAVKRLSRLPLQTAWALVIMQQYIALLPDFNQPCSHLEFVASILRNLALVAEAAYQIEISQRGFQDTAQFLAVARLRELYEQAAVTPPSHTAHEGRHYKGRPRSPFGKFVADFMAIADPDPRNQRGTIEAISYAAWPQRVIDRGKEIRKLTDARHQTIVSILNQLGV